MKKRLYSILVVGPRQPPLAHQLPQHLAQEVGPSMFPWGSRVGLAAPLDNRTDPGGLHQLLPDVAVGIEPLPHLQASLVVVPLAPGWPEQLPHDERVAHSVPQRRYLHAQPPLKR